MTSAEPGALDAGTVAAYERGAEDWAAARTPSSLSHASALLARRQTTSGVTVDLGCGPGWHLPALGDRTIALDAARSMLDLVPGHAAGTPRVQADLARLPFAAASVDAGFATKAYVHLGGRAVPRALAELHRALAVDAPVTLSFFGTEPDASPPSVDSTGFAGDGFPGRRFSLWQLDHLEAVLDGAGLECDGVEVDARGDGVPQLWVRATRGRTLPDTVGPDMRLLVCGLNPSQHAADAGIGFVTPGNRFWPAAIAAGLVARDRDPWHALDDHGIGMTDLAKRATRRADELHADEYRSGLDRVERLVRWLEPASVCFVGLAGYRTAVERGAVAGTQERGLGGRPVYVMPSTSGLNAHARLEDLTDHLRAAMALGS